ncbi:hypothetical protein [Parapedobacter koreensis]|uniref:Uncharacterized protein n=1 Tax=Parapedobacter koreensis TaxID=332977 RepID=A0A1H7NJF3_9SPHI|nr:hypothetical protein [Parapedobacter koreensis]SEL23514.1 hypothetical protein SAMN05421740_1045 [Parapedobacter koreensis]
MKQPKSEIIVNVFLLALVLFIIAFFLFYDKYNLFRFPFDANVWGTASDWVMIFVTAITAYYLYQSLKSQREIQLMQQKVTKIEEYDYLMKIKPNFKISIDRSTIKPKNLSGPQIVNCLAILEAENHTAINVKVLIRTYINNELQAEYDESFDRYEPKYGNVLKIDQFEVKRDGSDKFHITYNITYDDIEGNSYKKRIKVKNKALSLSLVDYPAERL